jgi:hypothetical protein
MTKENETYLWGKIGPAFPRAIIATMLDDGMIKNVKQAWRTLEKWCKKGVYDYGVALDLGWKCSPAN